MPFEYNPWYRRPKLTVTECDKGLQVILSDGRALLRDYASLVAKDEELVKMAEEELFFLVIRGFVQISPYLKPYNEGMRCIQLTEAGVHEARQAAFLAGRLHYVPTKMLKRILVDQGREEWNMLQERIERDEVEAFDSKGKNHYSADGICEFLPQHWHEVIYSNSKVAVGSGFSKKDLHVLADSKGVLLSRKARPHPLEEGKPPAPVPIPRLPNNLPPPPSDLDLHKFHAMDDYPLLKVGQPYPEGHPNSSNGADFPYGFKQGTNEYRAQQCYKRIRRKADANIYRIGEHAVNRYQMMKYLVWLVGTGKNLTNFCTGLDGAPTVFEVEGWETLHPDFKDDMEAARRAYAQVAWDKAGDILEKDIDPEELKVVKFKHEAYMKRAAILSSKKYSPKQILQTEDLDNKNVSELREQVLALLLKERAFAEAVIEGEVIEEGPDGSGPVLHDSQSA